MRRLTSFFIGLFFFLALSVNAQEKDYSPYMQYFENGDFKTVIELILECNKNKNISEETRQSNEFYLNISLGLIGDFKKVDIKILEDKILDESHLSIENIVLSYSVLINYYTNKQHYEKAIELNDKLLSLAKQYISIESENYANLLNTSSVLHSYVGDYSKALEIGEQVLNIREKILGKNHPDYAATLSFLSNYYFFLGDYSKALDNGNQALNIQKKVLGENHPDFATTLIFLSNTYSTLGEYTKAIEYLLHAINVYEQSYGDQHPLYGTIINNLSQNYYILGNYQKAIELAQKALHIQEIILGRSHSDYALTLNNIANYYSAMGDYTKAIELGQEALNIQKNVFGENHLGYATSLNNIANYYSAMGDHTKAIELGQEALNIQKNVLGENHSEYATSLNNLANYYSVMGDYTKAIELAQEALNIKKNVFGENHSDYALSLNNLAGNYSKIGDYSKTIDLGQKASNIYKNIYGEKHPDYAVSLSNLASHYSAAGNYSKAIELGQEAASIFKQVYGVNHSNYASSLNNLAHNFFLIGNYSKALELGQHAASIRRQLLGENHHLYATSLGNLAIYYSELGNYSLAKELHQTASTIIKETFGEEHPDYALSLNNLASFYSDIRNYSKAIELGEQALNIQKIILGDNHPDYALSLGNIANYYSSLGDYSKAVELGENVLNIRLNIFGDNHPDYAQSLSILAYYYRKLGDFSKAIDLGKEALDIKKKVVGENHPDNILTLDNLAVSFLFSKNYNKSAEYLTEAIQKQKSQLQSQFSWLTENERELYWGDNLNLFLLIPSFSYSSGNISQFVNLSYDGALMSKSLMLNSSIELNNLLMETGNEEVIDKVSQLRMLQHTLNKLYEKPVSERYLNTDSLEDVSQKLERELLAKSKEYGDYTRFMSISWQDVQKSLNDRDVAIEFVEFPVFGTDSIMYAALVLRKEWDQPQMIPLFEIKDIEKFLGQTPDKLYSGYVGKQLYQLMWKPLEEVIQKGDNIYFSAAGVYYKLALEYLPSDEGIPICDMYNFRRLSSTRQLAVEQTKITYSNAILYGGIQYDVNPSEMIAESKRYRQEENLYVYRGSSMDVLRGNKWVALDNTIPEVDFISGELTNNKIKATVLTGTNANEESIKALSGKRTSILHLATHGFFLPVEETHKINYFQMLGRDSNPTPDMSMRRSGLIMAGGNRAWLGDTIPEGVDDGILTAQEISALDLREMDLVILSACETGLGDISTSEGVFGLQRAFKKAGANTLVMSLWKVNDQVTKSLMSKFYKELMAGKTKHESFLIAQQFIRSSHPEPQNWAAFVMMD